MGVDNKSLQPITVPTVAGNNGTGILSLALVAAVLAVACWGAQRTAVSAHANTSSTGASFGPTVSNPATPPRPAPAGMVWIPGGEFSMGANDPPDMDNVGMQATKDARPIHRVYVDGFFMDKTDVTNAQFARFVKATGYVTVAERKPRAEDYPSAPPENLVAGSVVFSPPNHPVPLDNHYQWWSYVHGANWRHPLGPQSNIIGKDNILSSKSPTKMRWLMRNGQASACPPRRNGNSPRAVAWRVSHSSGAASSGPTVNGWPTPTRAIFPTTIRAQTDTSASPRWRSIRPMDMAYTTWRETCGSGPATGIGQTTTSNW